MRLQRKHVAERVSILSLAMAAVFAVAALGAGQRASTPKAQDKTALGEGEVKQLLLLMDADKNGKISKEEYMKFMAAEFDRLDKDHSGELDPKELAQSQLRVSHPFTSAGK